MDKLINLLKENRYACIKIKNHKYKKRKKTILEKIRVFVLCKTGRMCCSGYGVYPSGVKCYGCEDCKEVNNEARK